MKYGVIFGVCILMVLSLPILTVVLINSREVSNRRAVLYDHNGKLLKEYSGKLEYVRRSENGVRFWLDGKRVIIQGGIIVVEDE